MQRPVRAGLMSARFPFAAARSAARREAGTAKKPALRVVRGEPGSNTRTKKMFAVIKTGGKQYRVAADDVITVAKLDAASPARPSPSTRS